MSVLDMFFAVIMLFVISITFILSYMLITEIQTNTDVLFPTAAQEITATGASAILNLDWAFVFIVGGVFMSIIIGAFLIPTHPVFAIASILIMIVLLVIVPQFTNMFTSMTAEDTLSTSASDFVLTNAIMSNFPLIILFFISLLIIVTYAKTRGGQIGT